MTDVKMKRFLVVPRDALDKLIDRHVEAAEATEQAKQRCAEEAQAMYVVELRFICTRDTPPVTVRKL